MPVVAAKEISDCNCVPLEEKIASWRNFIDPLRIYDGRKQNSNGGLVRKNDVKVKSETRMNLKSIRNGAMEVG